MTHRVSREVLQEAPRHSHLGHSLRVAFGSHPLNQARKEVQGLWLSELRGGGCGHVSVLIVPASNNQQLLTQMPKSTPTLYSGMPKLMNACLPMLINICVLELIVLSDVDAHLAFSAFNKDAWHGHYNTDMTCRKRKQDLIRGYLRLERGGKPLRVFVRVVQPMLGHCLQTLHEWANLTDLRIWVGQKVLPGPGVRDGRHLLWLAPLSTHCKARWRVFRRHCSAV